jgi:hypothetical protein
MTGPARDWVVTTQHVPRFRALLAGGKTPTSCLSLYSQHTVAYKAPRAVLSRCGIEVFGLPILRVQAPLYRKGHGYNLASGCPAAGSPVAAVLAWVPPSSGPLPGRRPLYKVPFPLGPAYSGYMPLVCLESFRGGGACPLRLVEAERGWRHAGL